MTSGIISRRTCLVGAAVCSGSRVWRREGSRSCNSGLDNCRARAGERGRDAATPPLPGRRAATRYQSLLRRAPTLFPVNIAVGSNIRMGQKQYRVVYRFPGFLSRVPLSGPVYCGGRTDGTPFSSPANCRPSGQPANARNREKKSVTKPD